MHCIYLYRPDFTYAIIADGYAVDWKTYFNLMISFPENHQAFFYTHLSGRSLPWKNIDPTWSDEGYRFVCLMTRDESYAVWKFLFYCFFLVKSYFRFLK
jgi:hypothetical protein